MIQRNMLHIVTPDAGGQQCATYCGRVGGHGPGSAWARAARTSRGATKSRGAEMRAGRGNARGARKCARGAETA
jgi:hypothetical protein